ncbi:protein kinase [Sinomonas sp. ASV486]|uniref:serine/threonine-protein kinase n=1 Tax=Sinomonas sp. ASV486 TaxID=3051170 RepID=UPI0027DCF234|nr:protein kinase [Sinomonas sp. ASV486]MDQ4491194.1 protein kinase [Sinomonas sp. ASV486]MDQ4491854.1 protein kinase [Sinomonas sp. ASV486]MDQ4491978.1 protein kinase [Sinomonas sp. ASV486]
MAESDIGLDPTFVGGRYRLLEVAGSGAMATVHRAHDEVLGRDVAVKTFRTHAPDPRHEERRRGEMQVLARLNHPSLVRLYDAGTDTQDDGTTQVAYLVMEFVDGTDLRQRLASGALTSDDARLLALDLAGALAYVHALGIVHRDIKPANILVPHADPNHRRRPVKLTDFGIARLTDASRLTLTNTTIGTANYLSPEQARGEKVGPASDIYSLGLVLLESLTGSMEFTGGAVEAAVARLLRDPRIPTHLGGPWASLLPRMTARDAADRPDATEIVRVLRGEAPADGGAPTRAIESPDPADGGLTQALAPAVVEGAGTRVMPSAAAALHTAPMSRLGAEQDGQQTRAWRAAPLVPELPQDPPAVPGHAPSSARPRGGSGARAARRPRRGLFWAAVTVGILAALLVIVPLVLRAVLPAQPANLPPLPASPAVSGQLGTHLDQLERSLRP